MEFMFEDDVWRSVKECMLDDHNAGYKHTAGGGVKEAAPIEGKLGTQANPA